MRWKRFYRSRGFRRKRWGNGYGLAWLFAILALLLTDTRSGLSSEQKDKIIGEALKLSWQWIKKRLFKMVIFGFWLLFVLFALALLSSDQVIGKWMNSVIITSVVKFISSEYTKAYFWVIVWLLVSYMLYVLTITVWKLTSNFRYELVNNEIGCVFYLSEEPSERLSWKDIVPDFKKFLRFSVGFVVVLIMFAFGLLFFIIPGLVLLSKIIFFGFRIIYRDEGIYRSISNSIEITAGFGAYILLSLLLILVFILLGIFLLIIGIVLTAVIGFSCMLIFVGYTYRVLEVAYHVRTNQIEKLQKLC